MNSSSTFFNARPSAWRWAYWPCDSLLPTWLHVEADAPRICKVHRVIHRPLRICHVTDQLPTPPQPRRSALYWQYCNWSQRSFKNVKWHLNTEMFLDLPLLYRDQTMLTTPPWEHTPYQAVLPYSDPPGKQTFREPEDSPSTSSAHTPREPAPTCTYASLTTTEATGAAAISPDGLTSLSVDYL